MRNVQMREMIFYRVCCMFNFLDKIISTFWSGYGYSKSSSCSSCKRVFRNHLERCSIVAIIFQNKSLYRLLYSCLFQKECNQIEHLIETGEEFYDDSYGGRRSYDYPRRHRRRTRNDFAEEFFKKRRPKIKLYPGMPLKINEDQSRLANDLDHSIQEIKTSLNHDESDEQDIDMNGLDVNYLSEIDLSITDQPREELKRVMKNNKLINIIDLVGQEQQRNELDIGKQKIKEDLKAPGDILNPTKEQIHHAIQAIKSQFKNEDPFRIIAKLHAQVIVKKRALNQFLNPFWKKSKDQLLLNLFIKYSNQDKACRVFSLEFNSAKPQSILNRLQYLIQKGMVRYNHQIEVFKNCLANLNKIQDKIMPIILDSKQKLAIDIQVFLSKLYLSQKVDRQFFYELASKINLFFKESQPIVRHVT